MSIPGAATRSHGAQTGRESAPAVLAAHAAVMAAGLVALLVLSGLAAAPAVGTASLVLVATCLWLLVSWKLAGGEFLHPYGLFLLAALPFHAGFSMLRVVGRDGAMQMLAEVSDASLSRTLALVVASLLALHLGALAVQAWSAGEEVRVAGSDRDVRTVGWLLLAVSAVPTAVDVAGDARAVLDGGYMQVFLLERSLDTASPATAVIRLLSPFFLPGIMFLAAGARDAPSARRTALLLLVVYSGIHLFIGFRAFALIPIAVFTWVWHKCVRPLPIRAVGLAGAASLVIVAPVVRAIRETSGSSRLSYTSLVDAYANGQNPLVNLLSELGSSVFIVSYTTDLVPGVRPHEWGMGYLRSLVNAVPMVSLPDPYGYAGDWLAWQLRPDWAEGGFGFAYSFIAEAYLNFGWIGGPLALVALGALAACTARWVLRSGDAARYAFVAAFLPTFIFFVRNESLTLARPIFWYALLPFVTVTLLRAQGRRLGGT